MRRASPPDNSAEVNETDQPQTPPPDIYVPAKWTLDAASGDVVLVRPHRPHHGDLGPRGEIVEVLERQTRQFVGTYFESEGSAFVQIDGTLFAQPLFVGDPGAKNVSSETLANFQVAPI